MIEKRYKIYGEDESKVLTLMAESDDKHAIDHVWDFLVAPNKPEMNFLEKMEIQNTLVPTGVEFRFVTLHLVEHHRIHK